MRIDPCSSAIVSVVALATVVVSACSAFQSPSTAVREAYQECNDGHYSDAAKLMSKDLIASASQTGGVKGLCDLNTRNGTIQNIEVGAEEIRGEGVIVPLTLTFKDGTKNENFRAPAIKEDSKWKVTLKSPE